MKNRQKNGHKGGGRDRFRDGQKGRDSKPFGQNRDKRRDGDRDRDDRRGGEGTYKPGRKHGHKRPPKPGGHRQDDPKQGQERRHSHHSRPDNHKENRGDRGPRPEHAPRGRANLWGTHAVSEAWLNPARKINALYITETMLHEFEEIFKRGSGLERPEPKIIEKRELDRMLAGAVHQGIAVDAQPLDEIFVQDLVARTANKTDSVLLMLDQVTDPHNVGAILRSASAFGADGVIMQRRHSPELNGILAKTASGAVEHIPVAYEINLSEALDYLKNKGFYAIGLDERGSQSIREIKPGGKTVLVLGAEGSGLRPKVREHCDATVRLPTEGRIASLNVSNAAAVALYALGK